MTAVAGLIQVGAAFVLLLHGARWLLVGSARMSLALALPATLHPCLLVTAFAMPMGVLLAVAALIGGPGMAGGGLIGLQMLLVLLGLGLTAVGQQAPRVTAGDWRDGAALVGATLLLLLLAHDGGLARWEGVPLLIAAAGYLWLLVLTNTNSDRSPVDRTLRMRVLIAGAAQPIAGVVLLVVASVLMVKGAAQLAPSIGLQPSAAGAFLLSLVAGFAALRALPQLSSDRLVADTSGLLSYVVTALLLNGSIVALLNTGTTTQVLSFDMWVLAAVTLVVLLVLLGSRPLSRVESSGFAVVYLAYLATLFEPLFSSIR